MSDGRFNPMEHMITLNNKQYLQVMWRLVWFRQEHTDWSIETVEVYVDERHARFRAFIKDESGRTLSAGTGSESISDFKDYIEKAETKSIGRALAILGYGTQFAPELDENERIVDSPADLRLIKITKTEAENLKKNADKKNIDIKRMLEFYNVNSFDEFNYEQYESAKHYLNRK